MAAASPAGLAGAYLLQYSVWVPLVNTGKVAIVAFWMTTVVALVKLLNEVNDTQLLAIIMGPALQ